LTKYTKYTITSQTKFTNELKEIRRKKIAWTNRERDNNSIACASPIFNSEGEMIGIIGGNFTAKTISEDKLQEYGKQIRATASSASFALGYAEYDI